MMSSAQLCPLAERQNINADSRSGGGGSHKAGPVGFLFNAPSPLSRTARREGMHTQFRSISNANKTFAIRLMTICGKYYKSAVILCRKPYLMIWIGNKTYLEHSMCKSVKDCNNLFAKDSAVSIGNFLLPL